MSGDGTTSIRQTSHIRLYTVHITLSQAVYARLQAIATSVMSVSPFVGVKRRDFHGTDFPNFGIFTQICRHIPLLTKIVKNI
jgi:hypothetical protein